MIKALIRRLNGNPFTRELIMIPIIFVRDMMWASRNRSFIRDGQQGLKQFKDIHRGKRCFIIGNGPSLSPDDLEKIRGEYSFAANRIYDIYPKTEWGPTYYGVQDFYVLREITKEIEDAEDRAEARFIVSNRPEYMCETMKQDPKNHFFYLGSCLSENRPIKFAADFSKTVGNGWTITYALIQLAVYMGFSEIYLMGVDHSYEKFIDEKGNFDVRLHMASHFEGARPYRNLRVNNVPHKRGPLYVSTKAYEKAEAYSRSHGVQIYNCTRGGCLETFERKCLENVLQ